MIRGWWETAKKWGIIGLSAKILVGILGGAGLITVAHWLIWDFLAPLWNAAVYFLAHIGQLGHK